MRLEDEIKQTKPFKSELQKLVLNINFTSSWLNASFSDRLKPFDITPHQYNVLRILKGKYPDSYCNQDISQRMVDKSSNATRIVDRLKVKGLVSKIENAVDRRQVDIKITEMGLKLLDEINELADPQNIIINEEKAKLMNEWLDELRG